MTKRERRLLILGLIVLAILSGVQYSLQAERRPRTVRQDFKRFNPDDFRPQQVVKPFPPIVKPAHVKADEVGDRLRPTELVLGVTIDGVSRAYPINMLTGPSREIFNDQLGDHFIAATW